MLLDKLVANCYCGSCFKCHLGISDGVIIVCAA